MNLKNSLRDVSASLARVYNQIRKQEIEHANAKKLVERELNAKLIRTYKQERLELFDEDLQDKLNLFMIIVLT